jgi:hypothetical protein
MALLGDVGRILVFAPAAGKELGAASGFGGQLGGVRAATRVVAVAEAEEPCTFFVLENALSFVKAKTVQMFVSAADIIRETGNIKTASGSRNC